MLILSPGNGEVLLRAMRGLVGDGQGNEVNDNPEYTRACAEVLATLCGDGDGDQDKAEAIRLLGGDPDVVLAARPTGVVVHASAGRRGAGSIDCRVCGTPIHQRGATDADIDALLPEGPWFDGHGETVGFALDGSYPQHDHAPAKEMGPVLGPFEYAELTYDTLRVDEGETLAYWSAQRGDWILTNLAGESAGEAYSDLTIHATGTGR